MADPLIDWVEALDRCWLERRFDALGDFLAEDVLFVAPGGTPRLRGADAAIESYRGFMEGSQVELYRASGHEVTRSDDAAVVEYGWEMRWKAAGETHEAVGREVLVLTRRGAGWRLFWRTQLPA